MEQNDRILKPEDYLEPNCPLCEEPYGTVPDVRPIPQKRIVEKLEEYMSRRDYDAVEKHLLYWLEEAKLGRDERGELMLRNELTGHYRKTGNREKSLENARRAIALVEKLGMEGSITSGTTYVNAATAMNAFGENEQSVVYFEKAKEIYEKAEHKDSYLLGGLYNNMGLTLAALGRYAEAYALFDKALDIMRQRPDGTLEEAVTYLNIANTVEFELGLEQGESRINELLDKAYDLLNKPDLEHDGYYAFVCEKCAPAFSYYGYFLAAEDLKQRAEEIYAGH